MTNIDYENKRLLDVVNEADEIVGAETRTDVHKSGLLHREIHVWMFDRNSNVFFQKRGLHTRSAGLLDATVGGHVNQGEDYIDAACREIKEETGIMASPSDLILLKKIKGKEDKDANLGAKINNFFRAVYVYKTPIDFKILKKEVGIPGGGFQKLTREFLLKPDKDYVDSFVQFVFNQELPLVLKYLK